MRRLAPHPVSEWAQHRRNQKKIRYLCRKALWLHRNIVNSYDNKELYPFQADERHENVILSTRKNYGVKMQLTFYSLPCNPSRNRGLKNTAICKCSAMGNENLSDSSDKGSRGDHRRPPPCETPQSPHRGAHLWPCSPESQLLLISLSARKAVYSLFFFPLNRDGWGIQGLLIGRHTSCRKQSPICC